MHSIPVSDHDATETLLDAALELARFGFAVFPIWPVNPKHKKGTGKHPRCWNGHNDATTDEAQITRWWSAPERGARDAWQCSPDNNIGIAVPDGMVIVDIDPRHGGWETLDKVCEEHGWDWIDSLTVNTGGDGKQIYLSCEPGRKFPPNLNAHFGPGIDLKQHGGFVVAPPSTHKSGGAYSWDQSVADIAPAPAWLTLLSKVKSADDVAPAPDVPDGAELDEPTRAKLDQAIEEIEPFYVEGQKHFLALAIGCYLRNKQLPALAGKYVVSQLPSTEPSARVKDAVWAWQPDVTRGSGAATLRELAPELLAKLDALKLDAWSRRKERQAAKRPKCADREKGPGGAEYAPPTNADASTDTADDGRVRVLVRSTAQHKTNAETIDALARVPSIYQRNFALVHVIQEKTEDYTGTSISKLPRPVLQTAISGCVQFYQMKPDRVPRGEEQTFTEAPAAPPEWCVAYVHEAQEYDGIPTLNGIIETPAVRPDGTIAQTPGFDEASGYYLAFDDGAFPAVPDAPTLADAREALAALREVFQDFPFAGKADCDVPIAAVLTLVARPAIRGAVPAFLFDASSSRSGKGYMLNAVSIIALGHTFAPMAYPSGDEQEKVLAGYARRGVPLIAFDNIVAESVFGGGAIERAVTAEDRVALRILGKSETPELTWRAVIVGTGNNVTCTRDMSARVIRARLEPGVERPEDIPAASFAHYPLLPWVRAERARLVVCALTIVRAYFVAKQPRQAAARDVADFSAWAHVVRDAIVWAGGGDVALTRVEAADTDTKGDALRRIVLRMHALDPLAKGKTARDWFEELTTIGGPLGERIVLDDALDDLDVIDAKTLGLLFRSSRGRVVANLTLCHVGDSKHGKRWAATPA